MTAKKRRFWMAFAIAVVIAVTCVSTFGDTVTHQQRKFLNALWDKESSCRMNPPAGDGGKAIGPYQIWYKYWLDAVQYDRTIGGRYRDCKNKAYAERIVIAYMKRYEKQAWDRCDMQVLAKAHNGGCGWRSANKATQRKLAVYWAAFQKCYAAQNKRK